MNQYYSLLIGMMRQLEYLMVHSTFEDDALGAKKVRNLPKINFDLGILTFSYLVLSSVKKQTLTF